MNKKIAITFLFLFLVVGLMGSNYLASSKKVIPAPKAHQKKERESMFAIYLSDGNGGYTESQSNSIPSTGYVLNFDRSMCLDLNGEEVDNVLYEPVQGKIIVNSNKTLNCYLYYDQGSYEFWNTNYNSTHYTNNETLVNNNYKYYIKSRVVGGSTTKQVCGVFGTTEYCLTQNTWSNEASIKSDLESLGATCVYPNVSYDLLLCSLDSVVCGVGTDDGKVGCHDGTNWNLGCGLDMTGFAYCNSNGVFY